MLQDLFKPVRGVTPAGGLHSDHRTLAEAKDVDEASKIVLVLGEGVVPLHNLGIEAVLPHVLEAQLGWSCGHKFIFR